LIKEFKISYHNSLAVANSNDNRKKPKKKAYADAKTRAKPSKIEISDLVLAYQKSKISSPHSLTLYHFMWYERKGQ